MLNRLSLAVSVSLPMFFAAASCSTPPKEEAKPQEVAPAPEPVKEVPKVEYKAEMKPTKGYKAKGTVFLTTDKDGLSMKVSLKNVSAGSHGFHIHEKGDCSAPDASSAGGHFNPANKPHGAPEQAESHVGDLGNVTADKKKTVEFSGLIKPAESFKDVDWSQIEGKAIILHANQDDLKSQPVGNAGGRIACGVITKVDAAAAGTEGAEKAPAAKGAAKADGKGATKTDAKGSAIPSKPAGAPAKTAPNSAPKAK